MADESISDKFWKLASYSATDLLGFGGWSTTNGNAKNEDKKSGKKQKSIWPDFVCSTSDQPPWGGYDEPDASDFDVRGRNYIEDRIKYKSKSSLFKLANLEMYDCSVSESYHIVTSNKSWYSKYNKKLPKDTFFFVYNMQLSSLNIAVVATFIIKTNQPPKGTNNENDVQSPKSATSPSSSVEVKKQQNDTNKKKKVLLINDASLMEDMLNDLDDDSDDDEEDESDETTPAQTPKQPQPSQPASADKKEEIESEKESVNEVKNVNKPKVDSSDEEKKSDKKIEFTVEDIESIPNIEQKISHDDIKCNVDEKNLWCPRLGYKPYDESIWMKFLKGDELFINERLKIIPRIVEGSWYFTFPQRPALLGMKTPQRCYRGPNYLEIDCEADQSLIASQITKAAWHISTYLVVDIMLTIEGQSKKELPERCIGGFQIRYVDSTKAIKLNDEDEDEDDSESEQLNIDYNDLDDIIKETHNDNNNEDEDNLENLE